MSSFIVASIGEWNKEIFNLVSKKLNGSWYFASSPDELNELIENVSPRYIFFPHWRWVVPKVILNEYECVCFHMTDVPYGRGGSPLQNLIVRGHKDTVLTALRMEEGLDTGPVYYKKTLSLSGSAHDIYQRAAELSWEMISDFIKKEPQPRPQKGEPVVFKRRNSDDSKIPVGLNLEQFYDYIRMLDAPDYPYAFIEYGDLCLEFNQAEFNGNELIASVKITTKD